MNAQPKRKLLSLSLIVTLLITICPISTKAASEYTYTTTESGTLAITGYTGTSDILEIPDQIDGVQVTGIADQAFQY
ncbi:MAG: hypothetical protein SPJ81_02205, partial [Lachnoclostridium sp.]|nr:hypothetical protein [Lachnoclostridium sp.]